MRIHFLSLFFLCLPVLLFTQNNAINLDGANDFAFFGDPAFSDIGTNDFTAEFWVNKQANTNSFNNSFALNKWDNAGVNPGGNEWTLGLGDGANTQFPSFVVESGTQSYGVVSSIPIPLNVWTHLAGVRAGDELRLYFNGQLVGTRTLPANLQVNNAGRRIELGVNHRKTRFTRGSFDEIRIWNRALSEQELQANLGCELTTNESGLMAYYDFNQGTASGNNAGLTTIIDRTGNGNDGTLRNLSMTGNVGNWVSGSTAVSGVCQPFSNIVPTVSQWGLILLSLLVVSLGTISVWRRAQPKRKTDG